LLLVAPADEAGRARFTVAPAEPAAAFQVSTVITV
jgi:hypothetical protein